MIPRLGGKTPAVRRFSGQAEGAGPQTAAATTAEERPSL